MDSKDFRLLVALHENARQSYRSLGKSVSLSAPAVRDRLKTLEKKGVLQGYWCYPDPSIFGREDVMVFFEDISKREDVSRTLSARDVAFVAWKLDGGLSVQTWPRDRSEPNKDLAAVLGKEPAGRTFSEPKHLTRLIRDKAIFVMPRLGALADSGELVYHLAVTGRVSSGDLRRSLTDSYLISETQDPPMMYLLCRATDLADVTSRTQALSKLPGVTSVALTLNKEILPATDFVHALVREKIQEWENARLGKSS